MENFGKSVATNLVFEEISCEIKLYLRIFIAVIGCIISIPLIPIVPFLILSYHSFYGRFGIIKILKSFNTNI
jgi:hypothetical protein